MTTSPDQVLRLTMVLVVHGFFEIQRGMVGQLLFNQNIPGLFVNLIHTHLSAEKPPP